VSRVRIGISGWEYDRWRGDFYPTRLARRRRLEYVTRAFDTLEINGTFYSLKSPTTFEGWYQVAPRDFKFAVRGSRFITHVLRLRAATAALANFFANGLLRLEDKLGPILWQCPPNMDWDPDTFETFCATLPSDARQASVLARRHDQRVRGRASYRVDQNRNLRHAFEVRDSRMMQPQMLRSLRRHGHAFVISDTAGKYPYAEDITAGFVYIRLHGAGEMYVGAYDEHDLAHWTARIERWASADEPRDAERITDLRAPPRKSRDVYVYFDNDAHGHAPFDALALARALGTGRDPCGLVDPTGQELPPPPRLTG
jgi:uncharacterized protein YecE (DUF72 family)